MQSLRRLIEDLEDEIDLFDRLARGRLVADPGYVALQQLPGVGPILAAVFVAEVGDVTRFATADAAGLLGRSDPQAPRVRHPRAPGPDHQAGLPAGPLGRGGVGQADRRPHPWSAPTRHRVADRRGKNIGTVAAARKQIEFVFYALRDHHVRALHPPAATQPGTGRRHETHMLRRSAARPCRS